MATSGSQVFSMACALVKRSSWRPMSGPVLGYVRAFTLDDPAGDTTGVLRVSHGTIADRLGVKKPAVFRELAKLTEQRVVIHHGLDDNTGVWSPNLDFGRWDVGWSPKGGSEDRAMALLVLSNLRFGAPLDATKPEYFVAPRARRNGDEDAEVYVRMVVHKGKWQPQFGASWARQEDPEVVASQSATNVVDLVRPTHISRSSSNFFSREEEAQRTKPALSDATRAVALAIHAATGFALYDGPKHQPLTDLAAAVGDRSLDDVAPVVAEIRARPTKLWMAALATAVQMLSSGSTGGQAPAARQRRAENLERIIGGALEEIARMDALGLDTTTEHEMLEEHRAELAACQTRPGHEGGQLA